MNQCILCAAKNIVLSEINPAGHLVAPEYQAYKWFGLIDESEARKLYYQIYVEKISFLWERCAERKKLLCIRDWPAINFLPKITPWIPEPSNVLEQRLYLQQAGFELKEALLVRRSAAVYSSIRRVIPGMEKLSIRDFSLHYGSFLNATRDIPRFYLEDLQLDAPSTFSSICEALGLRMAADFLDKFFLQKNTTGNNTLPSEPESSQWQQIRRIDAKAIPMTRNAPAFARLDRLAGYRSDEK